MSTVLCTGYQRVRPNGSITGASLINEPRQMQRWGNRRVPEPVLGGNEVQAIEGGYYWLYSEWPRVA